MIKTTNSKLLLVGCDNGIINVINFELMTVQLSIENEVFVLFNTIVRTL